MSQEKTDSGTKPARWLTSNARLVLFLFVLFTALLIPAALFTSDRGEASAEPGGEAFDLRDELEFWLISPVFPTAYIVEARNGDVLTKVVLWELLQAQKALLEADHLGQLVPDGIQAQPLLTDAFSTSINATFQGVFSFADAVDRTLRLHPELRTDLENASEDQVKLAVNLLLENPDTKEILDQLSVKATSESRTILGQQIKYWSAPAFWFIVTADNEILGGGTAGSVGGLAASEAVINKEKFSRNVQEILRGGQENYELWGVAIDQNLEAEEEGTTAGVYIMLTVIAALAVISLALRSYWATSLTAIGIGALIIWLKGISALVGIKGGLIIEFIVPIAMISLGVDFAVHAIRRYREERVNSSTPNNALLLGFSGVLGALFLAMISDSIAFLSNVPSGIEAIVYFGLAAGIAVLSAFIVLGVVVPLALAQIETRCPPPIVELGKFNRLISLLAGLSVTILSGASVILMVALSLPWGIVLLGVTTLCFIVLPFAIQAKNPKTSGQNAVQPVVRPSWVASGMARLVGSMGKRPLITVVVASLITSLCVVLALRLESSLDVKDFFDENADFVVALDKADEHIGRSSGEGGTIYIRGDFSNPEVLRAINAFMSGLVDNKYIGNEADGEPSIFSRNIVDIVKLLAANESFVKSELGSPITDIDRDGLPDTRSEIQILLDYAMVKGVPAKDFSATPIYTVDAVRTAMYHDPAQQNDGVAAIIVGIPGTREQTVVAEAEKAINADLTPLRNTPGIKKVGLTGSPFTRNAEITATTRALRTSLPIAAVGALIALAIAMRSIPYAVVTVIPVGLVVAWLYAFMFLAGFALNFVTATIGALSIGVGIDYSIHMTERFREELSRATDTIQALRRAAAGTGTALLGSAGSSIVGFTIMGFAPMPMFSTYGILTATMIFLALAASILVLPSLLVLVAGREKIRSAR